MNPIYNEYIKFLKDNNINLPIEEGYYWLDNQIIKAYDKQGNLHKLYRLKIDDDLNITCKQYKYKQFEIESWEETIKRNVNNLLYIEQESLDLINNKINAYNDYEPIILTSGGKDSSVTTYLVRQVVNARCLFSNTSLDCADTYLYIKNMEDCTIINPKEGFYQWQKRLQFIPNRFSRACCSIYKENQVMKYLNKSKNYLLFMGMRNEESSTRSDYKDEKFDDRWGNRQWMGILPIRKWTEEDVWLYTWFRNIPINTKYKKGYMRAGCAIACPFATKSTWILDKYWYSKMYERWHDILEHNFINMCLWTRLNCTLKQYHMTWNSGICNKELTNDVINEFAEYMGLDVNIAEKYFNHTCEECGKKVNKKDVIAMNLKLVGRNTNVFYCKKHLMDGLNLTKEQWDLMVKDFKATGCSLF